MVGQGLVEEVCPKLLVYEALSYSYMSRHLVEMVGQGLVEVVCPHDVIGRLMIQCARSSGLAHVLENLMGFDGDEFYLKEWGQLVRFTAADVC